MIDESENMFWGDIGDIKRFTENTKNNKDRSARKTASIISAGIQLMENYIKGIKRMNAYDASSTIFSDANWIKNCTKEVFTDDNGSKIPIEIGKIYYIDYGSKTFRGELAYFHYGLCIGICDKKLLIIPISSGTNYFNKCYHPVNNPNGSTKFRQGLLTEGFQKDCVLFIHDTKFISAGRLEKECVKVNNDILKDIQMMVFMVQFPAIYQMYSDNADSLRKLKKECKNRGKTIKKLKQEIEELKLLVDKQQD